MEINMITSTFVIFFSGKKDKGKKGSKDDDAKKKKVDDDEDPGFKLGTSNFLADLMVANMEYDEVWKDKDESNNPHQTYYADMIRAQNTAQVEAEVRKVGIFLFVL